MPLGIGSFAGCPFPRHGEHYGESSHNLWDIPPFVFQHHGVPVAPEHVLHTATLLVSSLGNPVVPLDSLHHANMPSPLTMFFSPVSAFTGHPFPGTIPLAHGGIPGVFPAFSGGIPLAPPPPPVAPPIPAAPPVPPVVPAVVPVRVPAVAPCSNSSGHAGSTNCSLCASSGHFQWDPSQAPQAQHDEGCQSLPGFVEQIHFYLRMPEFSTGHTEDFLFTDGANQEASWAWEGQLRLTIKEGSLQFLFENKGSLYHGQGFKMLATLMQHCHPDTVSNAFMSLLSLFNDVQGNSESILKYHSKFDGLTLRLACCKVIILSILLVMLFLRALHGRHTDIVEQF
jgi:hypothetical protein